MSLVATATMHFAESCSKTGIEGIINYDDSDASKGFDASEVFDVLHEYGFAQNINYGRHSQPVDECLLQLADLFSFYSYRRELAVWRGDPEMRNDKFSAVCKPVHSVFGETMVKQPRGQLSSQSLALHYLVARRYLAGVDSAWVEKHLLTPGEMQAAAASSLDNDGVSVIRDSSHMHFKTHGYLP